MKTRCALFLVLFVFRLFNDPSYAAGPTREEVRAWTKQYEAGMAAAKKPDMDEAFRQFMGALKIAEGFGPKDIRLAENLATCGMLLRSVEQPAGAEPFLRRAAAVREAVRGDSHRETAWAWLDHAEVLTDLDKLTEAEALIQRAKRNLEKAFGPYHSTVGSCLAAQARIKAKQKQFKEAEELYKTAVRYLSRTDTITREGLGGARILLEMKMSSLVVARTQVALAELYMTAERYADAASAYQEAIKLVESKQGKDGPAIPRVLVGLAEAQMQQRDFQTAGATIEQATLIASKSFGPEHPVVINTRVAKVNLFVAQEKWPEAEVEGVVTLARAALKLEPMDSSWIPLLETMVKISEKQGNADNAKQHRAQIVQIKELHQQRFAVPAKSN